MSSSHSERIDLYRSREAVAAMTKLVRRLRDDESGQIIVLVAILMVGLVAVVGLVTDGGLVFSQRRDLQNVADAAALAGAMQIDQDAYRASGAVALDEPAARQAAEEYLGAEGNMSVFRARAAGASGGIGVSAGVDGLPESDWHRQLRDQRERIGGAAPRRGLGAAIGRT